MNNNQSIRVLVLLKPVRTTVQGNISQLETVSSNPRAKYVHFISNINMITMTILMTSNHGINFNVTVITVMMNVKKFWNSNWDSLQNLRLFFWTSIREYKSHKPHKFNKHFHKIISCLQYYCFPFRKRLINKIIRPIRRKNFKQVCTNQIFSKWSHGHLLTVFTTFDWCWRAYDSCPNNTINRSRGYEWPYLRK